MFSRCTPPDPISTQGQKLVSVTLVPSMTTESCTFALQGSSPAQPGNSHDSLGRTYDCQHSCACMKRLAPKPPSKQTHHEPSCSENCSVSPQPAFQQSASSRASMSLTKRRHDGGACSTCQHNYLIFRTLKYLDNDGLGSQTLVMQSLPDCIGSWRPGSV